MGNVLDFLWHRFILPKSESMFLEESMNQFPDSSVQELEAKYVEIKEHLKSTLGHSLGVAS